VDFVPNFSPLNVTKKGESVPTKIPAIQAHNISKSFAGIKALVDVSLTLWPGEVHALMGENGAGKSTLMKVLAGLHSPDAGQLALEGKPAILRSPHEAILSGIAMIHQELMPIPDMTVAENIMLGREPASGVLGWIDRRALHDEVRRLVELLGIDLPVHRKMRQLSVAQMQTVEIAKALGQNARVLIMDEPTAAISEREVEALFKVIAMLKQRGVAIVYITHKMDEVFRIADRITVLRDGSNVGTYAAAEIDQQTLIALMVGRPLGSAVARNSSPGRSPGVFENSAMPTTAIAVRGLGRRGSFKDVTFEVRQGEILGITGLMGAGRTELVSAIFGLMPADEGEIVVCGRPVRIRRPTDAIRYGIGMVTEDRKEFGLVPTMSVAHNITLASLSDCCVGPLIRRRKEAEVVGAAIQSLSIKIGGGRQRVNQLEVNRLSGGNQQKVVIARSLLAGPSIIILDEPTRGIDVGAKAEVYTLIAQLAERGKAIVVVSSELPEVLALSDRLLVMRQGTIVTELNPRCTSQEEVLRYAMLG
jgi:ABC-type sugar transport system ATPase subunit